MDKKIDEKKIRRKIIFIMIFMYFIAPQIWGLWMVFKLKIITFSEYLHLATSPFTILLLFLFFFTNWRYYIRKAEKFIANNNIEAQNELLSVPFFHILSIVLFGIIATFLVMLTLYFTNLGFVVSQSAISFKTVIIGMLAGASLTFIFFFLFTTVLIRSFETIAIHHKIAKQNSLFNRYMPLNIVLVITGIFLMVISTVEAASVTGVALRTQDFIRLLNFNLLTLLLPITMGTLLLVKQVRLSIQSVDKKR